MEKRANDMMKGFGMMSDPFKNDPFFSGGGNDIFGKMDSMMNDMRGGHMMSLGDMQMGSGSGNGGGKFVKQTYSSSTKMGPDGRPIKETYQTNSKGGFG
jgi:hypothetical protein